MDKLDIFSVAKISTLVALTPTAILGSLDIVYKFQYLIEPRSGAGGWTIDVIRDTMLVTALYATYLTLYTLERNEILEKYGKAEIKINRSTNLPAKNKQEVTIDDFFETDEKSNPEPKDDDKSFDELKNDYLRILSGKPRDYTTLVKLADLYYKEELYGDSLKTLKQINPKDSDVWFKIGDNFKELSQMDDAHRAYAKANE
ncbi:MAG: hypothetical protein AABW84_01360 [Nanoarchaeota archaeon]